MYELLDLIGTFGSKIGPWIIIILISYLFIRIIMDKDRADLWRGKVYRAAFALTGKIEHEKKFISNDIKGKLNIARRELHEHISILPKAIDIHWVENMPTQISEIHENQFIVRLDPTRNQHENIVLLAQAIVSRTTLSGIRHSIEEPLQSAIDMNLTRKLLSSIHQRHVLDWFLENDYKKQLSSSEQHRTRNLQISDIDEKGLFTRMLLVELEDFSREIKGLPPRPYMAGEIEGLVAFLHSIATRQAGQEVPLSYMCAYLRIGVIMVAKTSKLLDSIDRYLEAMQIHLSRQAKSIYVLMFDKDWLGDLDPAAHQHFEEQVKYLSNQFDKVTTCYKYFDLSYRSKDSNGNTRQARCLRYVAPGNR